MGPYHPKIKLTNAETGCEVKIMVPQLSTALFWLISCSSVINKTLRPITTVKKAIKSAIKQCYCRPNLMTRIQTFWPRAKKCPTPQRKKNTNQQKKNGLKYISARFCATELKKKKHFSRDFSRRVLKKNENSQYFPIPSKPYDNISGWSIRRKHNPRFSRAVEPEIMRKCNNDQ